MKENQNIEWKESWRDEYLKWICGFANAQGGELFIGVNDKGTVVGLEKISKLLEDIPNKVRDILGIVVEVNSLSEVGKDYLQIVVEPYPYPVSYKGQYHIRSGSTKQELKGAALDKFLLKKQGLHWDSVPIPGVDLEEFDLTLFRKRALRSQRLPEENLNESDNQLLDRLRLLDGTHFKRAAVLLFHNDPEKFVTGAYIKIAFFESNSELLYQDEIHGNLFEQVEKTLDLLLTKYLKAMITYEGIQRVETFPYPVEALREALLNSIAHKDYSSGVPIQISVYENKLMIWNNGQLHSGWTVENLLKKHSSQPYNPDIANAFFRAGMIESWGRGIEKMYTACEEHGIEAPELDYEEGGLWITFKLNAGLNAGLNASQLSLLNIICENPGVQLNDLAKTLGKSVRTLERQVSSLVKKGHIERRGSRKTGGYYPIIND
ncbi:MAG: putative DNA binding domain-containing protein [Lentisphaeraceae bacterium]|nr:putative DNA binding domain-containing protein [Lentisphaeraceae bacterium]